MRYDIPVKEAAMIPATTRAPRVDGAGDRRRDALNSLHDAVSRRERAILSERGQRYVSSRVNFDVMASLLGCSPADAILALLAKHVATLYVQRDAGFADRAAVEDAIVDIRNYLLLLAAELGLRFEGGGHDSTRL